MNISQLGNVQGTGGCTWGPQTVAAGDSLIVCVLGDFNDPLGPTGQASYGATPLTLRARLSDPNSFWVMEIHSVHGLSPDTQNLDYQNNGGFDDVIFAGAAYRVSGLNSVGADRSASATSSSTTPSSGSTAVTRKDDELLIGFVAYFHVTTMPGTWSNSFTDLDFAAPSLMNDDCYRTGYKLVSDVGAYVAARTGDLNNEWGAMIVTFRTTPPYGFHPIQLGMGRP